MVIMLDRERHAEAVGDDQRSRRADPLHHRWRRLCGAAGGHRRNAASICSGGSAEPRRGFCRPPRSSHGRSDARAPVAARRRRAPARGGRRIRPHEVLDVDRLVTGHDVFFAATGVTDGDLLQGVRYQDGAEATTESLVMRSRSGTVRKVQAKPQPVEAARADRHAIRLTIFSSSRFRLRKNRNS